MNHLKHLPKISKRDKYGNFVIKYIVLDSEGFNIGEFDVKSDAMVLHFNSPNSQVFKFLIYELIS